MPVVMKTSIPGMTAKTGKVRDIYDFGDALLLVSSDRISAFDWVLPCGIPSKGAVLNQMTAFWFDQLKVPNHTITTDVEKMPFPAGTDLELFRGRSTLARKCKVIPIECIVRGYITGSGWSEYKKSGTVCGLKLPENLVESDRLNPPLFTPSTKAETGHDENITFEETINIVGKETAEAIKQKSLDLFIRGAAIALEKGIIIADTKFEFGRDENGEIILIDEVLTPDSSRFWPADQYKPGQGQPSYDKQFVRDWLLAANWDKDSPPPTLPPEIIEKTEQKYVEAYERLTGAKLQ